MLIKSMSGTSGRQRVQNDVLGRYLLALPNNGIASAFAEVVQSIQQRIAGNHQTAQTLTTRRDRPYEKRSLVTTEIITLVFLIYKT